MRSSEVREVAERLRHLLAADLDEAVVHPVARRSARPSATAWARSFSWCGNARSWPPPWRSKPSPSRSSDITTHSVCQPGPARAPRRRPRRLARLGLLPEREVGGSTASPRRRATARRRRPAATRATGGRAARSPRPSRPRSTRRRWSRRRVPRSTSSAMSSTISLDVGGGVGIDGRPLARRSRPSPRTRRASHSAAISSAVRPSRVGPVDDVVVDVGDVRDVADLEPRPLEVAAQHVEHEREPAVAEVGRAVDRRPTHVHRHLARLAERELADSHRRRCRGGGARAHHNGKR